MPALGTSKLKQCTYFIIVIDIKNEMCVHHINYKFNEIYITGELEKLCVV